jgi:hypothetical protein
VVFNSPVGFFISIDTMFRPKEGYQIDIFMPTEHIDCADALTVYSRWVCQQANAFSSQDMEVGLLENVDPEVNLRLC